MDLNVDEGVRVEVPEAVGRDYVMLPRTVAEADIVDLGAHVQALDGRSSHVVEPEESFWVLWRTLLWPQQDLARIGHCPAAHFRGRGWFERGIHHPSVEQSIAAINLARPSDLTVIDAIEGSDGKGQLCAAGYADGGQECRRHRLCRSGCGGIRAPGAGTDSTLLSDGSGAMPLDEIEVLGESIETHNLSLIV